MTKIKSNTLNEVIIYVENEDDIYKAEMAYPNKAVYTEDEIFKLANAEVVIPSVLKNINNIKKIFGGLIVDGKAMD